VRHDKTFQWFLRRTTGPGRKPRQKARASSIESVTAANIMPRNAVGRIPNRATRNRPKIRPFTITPPPGKRTGRAVHTTDGKKAATESGDGSRSRPVLLPTPGRSRRRPRPRTGNGVEAEEANPDHGPNGFFALERPRRTDTCRLRAGNVEETTAEPLSRTPHATPSYVPSCPA
jgi:hypothetical protein